MFLTNNILYSILTIYISIDTVSNIGVNTYAREHLDGLWGEYEALVKQQELSWRHCPILFVGESWAGKDTIADAVISAFSNKVWGKISKTSSRYLTRNPRDGEEDWPLNFVSDSEFDNMDFLFAYDFSWYRYGLSGEEISEELRNWNVCLMWSANEVMKLFEKLMLLSKTETHIIPPLIINVRCDSESIAKNIDNRMAPEQEKKRRKKKIWNLSYTEDMIHSFSFFKEFAFKVDNIMHMTPEWNQYFFEENILFTTRRILNHIWSYLDEVNMYQRAFQDRVEANQRHKDNRP